MRHRSYSPVTHGPLAGLDYAAVRPFVRWKRQHLETSIRGWLQLDPPCLELATLAHGELMQRGAELTAEMSFADADLQPIPWLQAARGRVAQLVAAAKPKRRGRGRIYVILRGGYTAHSQLYGAYVGSTGKTVETRFKEHRTGRRAARGLERHGIELLYSLFDPLNPVPGRPDLRRQWETRLHEALAPVVPKVTGDVAF